MKTPTPKISIIIPCYNYAHYLPMAIESILEQDFVDFELLLLNDGSTDNTVEVIRAYAARDQRIVPGYDTNNLGVCERNNQGMRQARGTYLHLFTADDYRLPSFLSEHLRLLQQYPEVGLCCSDMGTFEEDVKKTQSEVLFPHKRTIQVFPPCPAIFFQNPELYIRGPSVLVKRTSALRHGGFDPQLKSLADWYLFHAIALTEGWVYLPKTLALMRMHSASFGSLTRGKRKTKREMYRNLLNKVCAQENRFLKQPFKESGLLSVVFNNLFWKLLWNPRWISFWPYINANFPIKARIKKSFGKKLKWLRIRY